MGAVADVMRELEAAGSEQTRKTYRRHGVLGDQFGVSYATLGQLTKRNRGNHALALELWATKNHDARILATMIADPASLDAKMLDRWVKDLDSYPLTDAFARMAGQTSLARPKFEQWADASAEWTGRTAWLLLASVAAAGPALGDDYFEGHLATIERQVHGRKNRVRDAMIAALVAIGVRSERLRPKAVAAAKRIGRVEVDHGDTDCRTIDALSYMEKILAHRAARAKKLPAKKKAAHRRTG
jgi:3-methyladenine DNA glycosylase AlkD